MNDTTKPVPTPARAPTREVEKDTEAQPDEAKPGTDENAAGFLKSVIDKPVEE